MIFDTIHVLYPDDRFVTHDTIIGWAHDHMVDDAVREHSVVPDGADYDAIVASVKRPTLASALEYLSDHGLVTFEAGSV